MRRKLIIVLLLLLVLIIGVFCIHNLKKQPIKLSANDISLIEIKGSKSIVYSKDKNSQDINEFVDAFNNAKRSRDDYSTTPDVIIVIILINQEKIKVYGGTQGFQSVVTENMQFNIQGKDLWAYLKKFLN